MISTKPTANRGTSLIGAMISILIMSTGMTALYSLYIQNIASSAHSRHVSTALAYARDQIEKLHFDNNSRYATLLSGNDAQRHQTITYQRRWQVKKNNNMEYHHINISVQWQDSSGDHTIDLETVISNTSTELLPLTAP